jgi:hypothetical protein
MKRGEIEGRNENMMSRQRSSYTFIRALGLPFVARRLVLTTVGKASAKFTGKYADGEPGCWKSLRRDEGVALGAGCRMSSAEGKLERRHKMSTCKPAGYRTYKATLATLLRTQPSIGEQTLETATIAVRPLTRRSVNVNRWGRDRVSGPTVPNVRSGRPTRCQTHVEG